MICVAAKQYHPDVSDATAHDGIFRAVAEAYEILGDDAKRAAYDETRFGSSTGSTTASADAPKKARKRTSADFRRKNEPWRVDTGGVYSRADHESAYRNEVYGTIQRIRMERKQHGAVLRDVRERVHLPTQQETLQQMVGRPLLMLLILGFNLMLGYNYMKKRVHPSV